MAPSTPRPAPHHAFEEVWQSFPLAPASYTVQRNLPMITTFDDYFRLPPTAIFVLTACITIAAVLACYPFLTHK